MYLKKEGILIKNILEEKDNNPNKPQFSLFEEKIAIPGLFAKSGSYLSFFNDKDLAKLSRASRTVFRATASEMNQRKQPMLVKAKQLLSHVVLGQELEAKAMIEKNPNLLLIESEAVDYSERTIIDATPFKAAIGAGDKEMWEMMLRYLEPQEALRQFREWFPPEEKMEEKTEAKELQPRYDEIALAIIQDADKEGKLAIEAFRKDITRQKEIRHGKHFNLHHLLAAYQAYLKYYDAFDPGWEKRDLFWNQVIGYVQRQMTVYDAQIHCSGVMSVLENPKSFSRELKFANGDAFFPLQKDAGLGFDFGSYSYFGVTQGGCGRGAGERVRGVVEKLCRAKTDVLAGLRESLEQAVCYQQRR